MTEAQRPEHGRAGGSLRDPSGFVFLHDGRAFRAVDDECMRVISRLMTIPLWQSLQAGRRMVPTTVVGPQDRTDYQLDARYPHLMEHEVIERITYPYEWCTSMLADAGILTLDLQLMLLEEGLGLKDASAYNVQFVRGRPMFMDVASVEEPMRRDIWFALGQFHRMFTYPLLLKRHRGWDYRSYFMGHPDGMSESRMAAVVGSLRQWLPGMFLDVGLPALLQKREGGGTPGSPRGANPSGQKANLQRLRRKLHSLSRAGQLTGEWAGYRPSLSYQGRQSRKQDIVDQWLRALAPRTVLDIGCNTGEFSFLAARQGASVIAIDGDADAIEILYRRLRDESADITPLVADVAAPSPPTGYMNQEHAGLRERVRSECVLALALIHHLAITSALPLPAISELLWDLTTDSLILEVVGEVDPMFQKLMRLRRPLPVALTMANVLAAFEPRFTVEERAAIGETGRHLLLLHRR